MILTDSSLMQITATDSMSALLPDKELIGFFFADFYE
jgi:hypothetical protein